LQVRPYRLSQTTESIHLLTPGKAYEMGMNFAVQKMGIDRFRISVASTWYPGNETFTGIGCETGHEDEIRDKAPPGFDSDGNPKQTPMQDVRGLFMA
jgi:hypothetical protein